MKQLFYGGVHPAEHKELSEHKPIRPLNKAPAEVVIPMSMHIGAPCKPVVAKGDTVMVGQVTRNVFSGAYSGKQLMSATGYGIRKGAAAIGYGAQKLGFNGIKAAAKGVRWTFTSAFPKTFKILGKGSIGTWSFAGKALMGSEDLGLKAVGTAMETTYQTTRVSVKTAKALFVTDAFEFSFSAITFIINFFHFTFYF